MADYERPSFNKEWWEKVSQFLEDNPDEGFDEDEVKPFIKFVVNKYMEGAIGASEEEVLQQLKDMIEKN